MKTITRAKTRVVAVPLVVGIAALASVGCSSDDCSTKLHAQAYDAVKKCMSPAQEVGCTGADGCDDALTWAVDPHGQCFLFPNGCIPTGFVVDDQRNSRCPSGRPSPTSCVP